MRILLDNSNEQTLTFIPRKYPSMVNYKLIEEGTGREVTKYDMTTSTLRGRLSITDHFLVQQDKFYSLDVFDASDSTLIYRDKVFVTNQDIMAYSINNGLYIEDESKNNEYVIYGEDITKPDTMTLTSVIEVE